MKRRYRLWVKVTHDELELPVAVAASQSELAKILGISPSTIAAAFSLAEKRGTWSAIKAVDVTRKEWEELKNV